MKLELGYIDIRGIRFDDYMAIEDGILVVNPKELAEAVLADPLIKSARLEIANPGESIRITPVKDVIEPRVKVEGPGGIFPGMISKVDTVGSGKTHVLRGMAVVTVGRIVGFQEGIIDMTGPGAAYTPFSKLHNLVLVMEPVEGIAPHDYEKAARMAGLQLAVTIGELARNLEPDETEVFKTPRISESFDAILRGLPRVGYVMMLQSQGLLHDTYVYGVDAKRTLSTLIRPTELMDGAIVSGNCVSACDKNTTYHHLNNPVVRDLLKEHGKTLNFVGMIITNETVYLSDKVRSSDWTAEMAEYLPFDGAIISQEGFGNPDTDLIMNCTKLEKKGIKTVVITDEYAGQDGKSQSLADADELVDAVVSTGNANMPILLPPMERVIGMLDYIDKIAGGHDGSLRPDGSIEAELQVITGATNELGYNLLSAR
ncbi:MAG: glycine/sarcosine/betaine reductase component B subunit [Saccharofermentanales bacterium]